MPASEAKRTLIEAWRAACDLVGPPAIFSRYPRAKPGPETAILAWGKASGAILDTLRPESPHVLAIVPEGAEPPRQGRYPWIRGGHPLPDAGSLLAGQELLRFFDELRRAGVRKLFVYLSGGASSSAWVPSFGQGLDEIRAQAAALYRSGWDIRRVNEKRATLCALKGGGASLWLHWLSPMTKARAFVISDVSPYGIDVVGSGPFNDGRTPHFLLSENADFIHSLCATLTLGMASGTRPRILHASSPRFDDWLAVLLSQARAPLKQPELLLMGGEPVLPLLRNPGRGGRMTHLALALYQALKREISDGRVLGLCASSDGRDGLSCSAGALLLPESARALSQKEIHEGLKRQASASVLARAGALLPVKPTGTNVQDAVALLLRP